jgi:hypothetical protein
MLRDGAVGESKRNSQTLMGSVREFVLGKEDYEGGDDSSEEELRATHRVMEQGIKHEMPKRKQTVTMAIETSDLDNSSKTSEGSDNKKSLGDFNPDDE